jgi:aminoacyl tRNA synthase complex-interacting multifunctional protein 1
MSIFVHSGCIGLRQAVCGPKSPLSRMSTTNTGLSHILSPVAPLMNIRRQSTTPIRAADAAEGTAAPVVPSEDTPDVSKLDIRVGTILSAEDHPEADSLYVEQIDLGEAEGPRTIVSGLKKYVSLDEIVGKKVLVLANLKARNMRGIKSHGMLLCASNAEHTEVEPLAAPADTPNGERVYFGENKEQEEPANGNQLQKKKFWEACQPLLKTDADGVANFSGATMNTSAGVVKAHKLTNATIS